MAGTIYQTNTPPIRGSGFTFYVSLGSQAGNIFQKTVTLAAGDVKVSKDGGGVANITAMPVEIAATGILAVTISAAEMTADTVVVAFCDAAGDEWQDAAFEIRPVTDQQTNIITAIWASASRTLTDYGTLVADTAAAVWASVARTLTDFGTLVADTVDGVWDEAQADHTDPDTFGEYLDGKVSDIDAASAAAVWAATPRTLTASAASTTATVSGSDITIVRGDTLSASLTGLGALTGYTSLWFTVKAHPSNADSAAIIQIKLNATGVDDGLMYFNGAAAADESKGSITIDVEADGDITIALDESLTDDLEAPVTYTYDVQVLNSGAVTTLTTANCSVATDITRSIT